MSGPRTNDELLAMLRAPILSNDVPADELCRWAAVRITNLELDLANEKALREVGGTYAESRLEALRWALALVTDWVTTDHYDIQDYRRAMHAAGLPDPADEGYRGFNPDAPYIEPPHWKGIIAAALAKNPNPSGHAADGTEAPTTRDASGSVGLGPVAAWLVRDPNTGRSIMTVHPDRRDEYVRQMESVNVKADLVPLYTHQFSQGPDWIVWECRNGHAFNAPKDRNPDDDCFHCGAACEPKARPLEGTA